jgi:hypothetical protein
MSNIQVWHQWQGYVPRYQLQHEEHYLNYFVTLKIGLHIRRDRHSNIINSMGQILDTDYVIYCVSNKDT